MLEQELVKGQVLVLGQELVLEQEQVLEQCTAVAGAGAGTGSDSVAGAGTGAGACVVAWEGASAGAAVVTAIVTEEVLVSPVDSAKFKYHSKKYFECSYDYLQQHQAHPQGQLLQ